jgi:hypothetical protein
MSGIPEIQTEYSSTYKRINVGGIFGGITAGGVEAIVYSEERRAERVLETEPISPNRMTIKRTTELELIIDPMQMVAIHRWLGNKIEEYQRIFGHIPSPEEIESKSRRHPQQ